MAATPKDLYDKAMSLNDEERAEPVGLLPESLEISDEDGVATAWLKEIERRVVELDSGDVNTESWSEVRSRVFETRDPRSKASPRRRALLISHPPRSNPKLDFHLIAHPKTTQKSGEWLKPKLFMRQCEAPCDDYPLIIRTD